MSHPILKQRQDLEEASRFLNEEIIELKHKRKVLINALNSIEQNKENILKSDSILSQKAGEIMRELMKNKK